nr:MAG TPA: hypothetical protein [Caudoviricetes sp.]
MQSPEKQVKTCRITNYVESEFVPVLDKKSVPNKYALRIYGYICAVI